MTSLRNRVFADAISYEEVVLDQGGLKPSDWCPCKKRNCPAETESQGVGATRQQRETRDAETDRHGQDRQRREGFRPDSRGSAAGLTP